MNYNIKNNIKTILFQTETGHRIYKLASRMVQKRRENLTDEEYVKKAFLENTGIKLNLENPVTFNDKLLWLSLNDRTTIKTRCADKYQVREYVAECGYPDILNELYGVYDSVSEIEWDKMPDLFFVKTNHDSGTYALIDKNDSKKDILLNKIESALKRNYYYESREWQYKNIVPKVICERYIKTSSPLGLVDYRFYCFGGEIGFIAVDIGTTDPSGKHSYVAKRNLYDEQFSLLNAKLKRDPFDPQLVPIPQNFDRMKEIARVLSNSFKHVRVDLYNVDGCIIFGEMTFCNGGGMQLLEPELFNIQIGSMMKIGD